MHILFLTEAFPPETKSASTLFFELAESLARKGHKVSVITRLPKYNIAGKLPTNDISGIHVYRCRTLPLARNIPLVRGLEHFLLAVTFFFAGMFIEGFDVILVYSPPLPLGVAGYWLGHLRNKPVVVNIQDLYPKTAVDLGLLKNKLLIRISKKMESFIYRKVDLLTVHSEGNQRYINNMGASNTEIIHNWVDPELVKPGPKENDFSRKLNLADKFVVSFAGIMGFAQGLDVVIDAAYLLKDNTDIFFLLVGDGVKRARLGKRAVELKLGNVIFAPTQPLSRYPQVLQASDICLVTLQSDLTVPAVPGKLLSIMASGRPVIASVPLIGDTPKVVEKYQCGLIVPAGQPDLLARAIIKLYNNLYLREKMGQNGRNAALEGFTRKKAVAQYEDIFYGLLQRQK